METTFALWASRQFGWGAAQVGFLMTYVGICSALMQGGLIGRLTRMFGEERLLLAGTTALAIGLLAIPLSSTLPILVVATGLLALGMGMTQPAITSLISRRAAASEQGEMMGVAQSFGSLARILGPPSPAFCSAGSAQRLLLRRRRHHGSRPRSGAAPGTHPDVCPCVEHVAGSRHLTASGSLNGRLAPPRVRFA